MPLLSVIIPTHNRARYAISTIRAVIGLSDEIEVVVSDTSVVDEISSAIADIEGRHRLKLVRHAAGISVVDNFNKALASATGDYLTFIGDDDLVTAQAVDLARWAKQAGVDALGLTFPASYFWPDFSHQLRGDFYAGTVRIADFSGEVSMHDPKAALKVSANEFGFGVLDLPRAYAGMVSHALVNKIVAKYGALFGGVSPDIYSAALIAHESELCVRVDFPIVIPGNSGASTAGQSANGGHIGKLRDNAHIGAFKNLVWDERIPEFYSVPTVWSFSLLKALEKIPGGERHANFMRMYVHCLLFHRYYRKETMAAMATYVRQTGMLKSACQLIGSMFAEVRWGLGKAFSMLRVTAAGKSSVGLQNITTTEHASQVIASEIRQSGRDAKFQQALASFSPKSGLTAD